MEAGTMNRNTEQEPDATVCDTCRTIPISYLSLDLDEPMSGWQEFFREHGIEILLDDLGRLSVPRRVLGDLLSEHEEREARMAAQRAEQSAARPAPVPVGVPALDDASPFESMVAAGITTPQEEFGGGRTPVYQELLDEQLAEGCRREAEARAEQEAVDRAQRVLEGRDE
jgi:hypothetical protein